MEKTVGKYTAKQICGMLIKTNRLHRKAVEAPVSRLGIHRSQHIMLMHLARDSGMSQKELASHLEISPAAVAVTIKKLEAGGYIEKKTAEKDSRYNEILITERGREIVAASQKYFGEIDAAMLEGVTPEKIDCFVECLEIMQNNLNKLCLGEEERA